MIGINTSFVLLSTWSTLIVTDNDFSKNFDTFLQMQNQFFEQWNKTNKKQSKQSSQDPWTSAVNNLWSSTADKNSIPNNMFGDMFSQGLMMSQLHKCFTDIADAAKNCDGKPTKQWQSILNKSLDELQDLMAKTGATPFSSMPEMTGLWNEPFAAWQHTIDEKNFSILGISDHIMPGLGPNREMYEKLQNIAILARTYQQATVENSKAFENFWPEVINEFKDKINDAMEKDAETISSSRSLYALWTETAEKVYKRINSEDDYQKSYSEMINAAMAFKKASDELRQDSLSAMNIPTRSEIDTLSERLQRTRRENRVLRAELDALKMAFENSQIKSTKSKSTSTKNKVDEKKASRKSVKKKTTKKKTARKKSANKK